MSVIELAGVSREFGRGERRVRALSDIDLQVPAGQTIGVLGDNGAGKTTLLRIITTLLLPTSGTIRVCGVDAIAHPQQVRDLTAVTFGGDRGLYSRLTGRQNLEFFAALRGLGGRSSRAAITQALNRVSLEQAADRKVETYSRGMRQRLHLAIGTLQIPRLLLLDEPTVGLDPVEAERTRNLIAEVARAGTTVVLTSHLLRDMETLASRIVMLRNGRLLYDLSTESFLRQTGFVGVASVTSSTPLDEVDVGPVGRLLSVQQQDGRWTTRIGVGTWSGEILQALGRLTDHPQVRSLSVERTSLDEVYTALASRDAQ